MEIKTIYIANDGTEFEDEDECLRYESSFTAMCEFVQLYDNRFNPIEWNPADYEAMWNRLYYIVIEPHREQEVEDWWNDTFNNRIGVSPFGELDNEWHTWKRKGHGDEPAILAFDFDGNENWIIFNNIYHEVKKVIKRLNLVDALC